MAGVCSSGCFIFAALLTLIFSHSCFIRPPVTSCASAKVSFSSICGEPAWIRVPASKFQFWTGQVPVVWTGMQFVLWANFRPTWPSFFPFSRNPKAALHSLSCWGSSQRLRRPGDPNGRPTRGSSCKIIAEGNPAWGPRWRTPSFRVVDSWKRCKDDRLFKL